MTVNQNDSPEQKQAKRRQAKQMVSQEVMANLAALDARLGYVAVAFKDDGLTTKLDETNRKAVPAAAEYFDANYRRILADTTINALRQSMNSSPLRSDFGTSLVQTLIDADIDGAVIRQFYDELKNVEHATENIFVALAQTASYQDDQSTRDETYNAMQGKVEVGALQRQTELTYLLGLRVLLKLGVTQTEFSNHLPLIRHLYPTSLPSPSEIEPLLSKNIADIEQGIIQKAATVEYAKALMDKQSDEIIKMRESLNVKPTDSGDDVLRKAHMLRKLGENDEAIATLQKYAQMFPSADAATKAYVSTAIEFAKQAQSLQSQGITGGLYADSFVAESVAPKAGLGIRDILTEYNGKKLLLTDDIVSAQSEFGLTGKAPVTFLRLDPTTKQFGLHKTSVPAGKLGVYFKPI